jgi:hypothetical protein
MSDKEQGIPLDGICGGAVGIVLARMDTHPDEFFSGCDKWKFIYKDYFRDAMTETEKGMIFDRIKVIRMSEFSQAVLTTLVEGKNTDEEEEDDWADKQMTKFGHAPIKREGKKVRY